MKRAEFEHCVRAAGAILETDKLLIIGSQALHGSISKEVPEEAERSVEVDIAVFGDKGDKADLVDGAIGEASQFHETFGYYAQGVVQETAVLPQGWKKRLVRFKSPNTRGVEAHCLEIHDLWIAKAIANRPKDIEFCNALKKRRLVRVQVLSERLKKVHAIDDAVRAMVVTRINSQA
ncbi:MAG: hypothetical protein A2289_03000 [Deltaproteobacteria bacterium RIFOXYA12_FULL_58_15]|nr:MAG: hypothetical protein A2289_03000 [Deltaproteobacteria bacterium RIFOXYA12_FULL_58_15]OGR13212.1 MAG: hypothetical protein A2341_15415 [Deltaproteobacteria bacterium RIFOXYB12_FULL_58_9]